MSNEFDENIPSTSEDLVQHLNNFENDEDEDVSDEFLTPSEVLKELTQAFLNESVSPKLLPEKLDLVDKMLLQKNLIERMMERNPNKKSLICSMHKMELCRIEYLINSYLRIRLLKIEKNPAQILQEHSDRLKTILAQLKEGNNINSLKSELLDGRELKFAQKLLNSNSMLFDDSFLSKIPASIKWLPVAEDGAENDRVFIEVLKDGLEEIPITNMADPNSEILLRLEKGSRHFLPFNCIQHLLENFDVCLL
ncbi:DNA replication complex GINS protein SLD5 [Meloidogyne graminicola]|uniref:DNA replication complex GINS protein SLD5 n=1 Tax=Meloidogyne graminicola TaxID=189291 RepID=A0A8S9ZKF7_9BILA|nr:DNA replication complex GINS protein SLD5 [Meloidogyne graminicola]